MLLFPYTFHVYFKASIDFFFHWISAHLTVYVRADSKSKSSAWNTLIIPFFFIAALLFFPVKLFQHFETSHIATSYKNWGHLFLQYGLFLLAVFSYREENFAIAMKRTLDGAEGTEIDSTKNIAIVRACFSDPFLSTKPFSCFFFNVFYSHFKFKRNPLLYTAREWKIFFSLSRNRKADTDASSPICGCRPSNS